MDRCFRPRWKVTSSVNLAPGLPRTSAQGLAHGEPRGPRLEARLAVGGIPAVVDLIRRLAAEPRSVQTAPLSCK